MYRKSRGKKGWREHTRVGGGGLKRNDKNCPVHFLAVHGMHLPDLSCMGLVVAEETRASCRLSALFLAIMGENGRSSSQRRLEMEPEEIPGWWRTEMIVVVSSNDFFSVFSSRCSCLVEKVSFSMAE